MERRVLLVGWDSADWQLIQPLVDAGKMPVLQRLIETGVSGRLASLEPMVSPLLWTSIVTGKRAYDHGIYSFTATRLDQGTMESVGSHHRTCHALWNILHQRGRRSLVCNWFASHPAEPVNGLTISNEFAVVGSTAAPREDVPMGCIHPPEHGEKLRGLRVSPRDVDASMIKLLVPRANEVDQENDSRLARLATLLAENFNAHSAFTYGLEATDWDFAAVYYEAIDLIAHYFMRYVPPPMPGVPGGDAEIYGEVVEGAYRLHDAMLGRLLQLSGPDTTVMLVSDHGFHSREHRPAELPNVPLALTRWHRHQGILVITGPGVRADELIYGAGLLDITPTILALFGLPIGQDMEGRVLTEAFTERLSHATIPSWDVVDGDFARTSQPTAVFVSSHQLLQRFVDLGYLAPEHGKSETQLADSWRMEQHCRALALLDGQRAAEALSILDELHDAEPERDDIAFTLATVLLRLGLLEEAEEIVGLLESTTPHPGARQLRAELESRRGNQQGALAALAQLENVAGKSVLMLNLAGATYLQLREISHAESVFAQSLAIEKENPSALSGLSFCRSRQGRYKEAAELALEGISLLFHHFYSHYCYGVALAHSGDSAGAIRAFENTLRFHPGFHQARHYLIHLLKHQTAAKPLVEHHRSVLFQRAAEQAKSDSRRDALGKELQVARKERVEALRKRRQVANEVSGKHDPERILNLLIVSGLPRSGTSLTMQMLEAGGLQLMTDDVRKPDESNPHGYYEWDRVKLLPRDPDVIAEAAGRAVKIVSPLLPYLPKEHHYRIVFLRRDFVGMISSQDRMRVRLTGVAPENLATTRRQLETHLRETVELLTRAPNVEWIELEFEKLREKCDVEIGRLATFCGLDSAQIPKMKSVVK